MSSDWTVHLRLFAHGCLLQYKALFFWATPIGYVTSKVLSPLFQLIFFVQLGVYATGQANALYFAVGNAIQLTAVNGIFGLVMTVGNERFYGTLPYLLGSPAPRLPTFFGRAGIHVLDGMTTVVIGFVMTAVLYSLDLNRINYLAMAVCILLISLTTSGLGLMLGSISLITRDVFMIANAAYFLLLLLCGINFPISRLPAGLQLVSNVLPMTHGVQAARAAVAGAGLGEIDHLLGIEALIGVAYAVAGYALFRHVEGRARSGGLLDAY